MNYKILKEIVLNIKNKVKCESCEKSFLNQDIHINDISNDSVNISCHCSKCETKAIVDVKLSKAPNLNSTDRNHQGLQVNAKKEDQVSQDDVLDFKNFIKDFSGDFKSLFKK